MGEVVCLHIVFFQHILILLRYERFITISWNIVFVLLLIAALLIGLIVGIAALTFLVQN